MEVRKRFLPLHSQRKRREKRDQVADVTTIDEQRSKRAETGKRRTRLMPDGSEKIHKEAAARFKAGEVLKRDVNVAQAG
ncbi:hypothetical protein DU508_22775 [Pedobacter chinensis]|uniref:Uncharacterized protein n=1 Tax=Pedobacter chinensis TaxID=2282421 RepID=A0A369PP50_9SPHI|nr:hypothetical protein DU508_23070 [Pedobacter chinensis]RDC54314.1 hypothetical protein DU508_22775 [Pedobacter chinensis]